MTNEAPIRTETAPSAVKPDEPSIARFVGATGWATTLLGVIAVVANQFGPRWIPVGGGYCLAAIGILMMLFHALRDGSLEIRRAYGGLGVVLAVLAIMAAFAPGPILSDLVEKKSGYHFLPWTPVFAVLALCFLAAPLGFETDSGVKNLTLVSFMMIGGLLSVGSVLGGIMDRDFLIDKGVLLAVLGLAYLLLYLANTDTSDGTGFFIAAALGLLGALAFTYALARATWPSVLADGPAAFLNAYQRTDYWKLGMRVIFILVFLGIAIWGIRGRKLTVPVRGGLTAFGLSFAAIFIYGSLQATKLPEKPTFLVPNGLILMLLGLIYLGISLGTVSDNTFITLTRRELAASFLTPIGYLVLLGIAFVTWFGYYMFAGILITYARFNEPMQEPILQEYVPGTFIGPFCVMLLVPALTMRLFSEEKRSGAMEVLLTAPTSELAIVASKILAAWLFYMVCWIPMGLYLVVLRVEGGTAFDYRPMLSLYIAIAVSGFAFMAMGAFFSSLTKNQIIAAALTFVCVLFLAVLRWHQYFPLPLESAKSIIGGMASASYWPLWNEALRGQLLIRDLVLQLSMGVFWSYLTLKSLEARKWI